MGLRSITIKKFKPSGSKGKVDDRNKPNLLEKNFKAETAQRNIKIKQKIGEFRSEEGAEIYALNRSCINTYKKHGINVYQAFIKAFRGETVIA